MIESRLTPDRHKVLALYRTMSTPDLRHLRWAYMVDRDGAEGLRLEFTDGRVALIDGVLHERGETPEEP